MEALTVNNFNPQKIPFQERGLYHFHQWDHEQGPFIGLFSGTIGSAKTSLGVEIAVDHCLENKGARIVVGRQKMPDVRRTIRKEVLDYIKNSFNEAPNMRALRLYPKKYHYFFNQQDNTIYWSNNSEIMFISWHDADWEKFRSLNISGFLIEEATENKEKHWPVVRNLIQRLGRQPHVKSNWGILLTNPDGPEHDCYEFFIEGADKYRGEKILKKNNRFTFFSKTSENPFIPDWYIKQLRKDLPAKEAERMLDGKWVSIRGNVIYSHYDSLKQYKKEEYKLDLNHPIHFSFDFNIGENKPMSMCFFQYIDDVFHFFAEVVVAGADTEELLQEAAALGHFDHDVKYYYHGDASGKRKTSNNKKSDYDIIEKFLDNYRTPKGEKRKYVKKVKLSNPPVRERHNDVNTYCLNGLYEVRLFVYNCPTIDKALRLTKLKKGGNYIEDDSKPYQHVGTALGYGVHWCINNSLNPLENFSSTGARGQ